MLVASLPILRTAVLTCSRELFPNIGDATLRFRPHGRDSFGQLRLGERSSVSCSQTNGQRTIVPSLALSARDRLERGTRSSYGLGFALEDWNHLVQSGDLQDVSDQGHRIRQRRPLPCCCCDFHVSMRTVNPLESMNASPARLITNDLLPACAVLRAFAARRRWRDPNSPLREMSVTAPSSRIVTLKGRPTPLSPDIYAI